MKPRPLFDSDDFNQSPLFFTKALVGILRMRYGHLLGPTIETLRHLVEDGVRPSLKVDYEGLQCLFNAHPQINDGDLHLQCGKAIAQLIEQLDGLIMSDVGDLKAILVQENLKILGRVLKLDPIDRDILACTLMFNMLPEFSRFADKLHETMPSIVETYACLLAVEPHEVRSHLLPTGRLSRSGLVRIDQQAKDIGNAVEPLSKLGALGFQQFNCDSEVRNLLVGEPQNSSLSSSDFDYLDYDLSILVKLIQTSIKNKKAGTNILLYGPPGSGKSEFAKVISTEAGAAFHAVGEKDVNGEEPARYERLGELGLAQHLLEDANSPSVCCFDEAEDLFAYGVSLFRSSPGSKVFMNRIFETNPVPVIWILNDIDMMPTTIRRRMSFALKMDPPSQTVRRRILDRMIAAHHVKVSDNQREAWSRQPLLSPGIFSKALQTTCLADQSQETLNYVIGGLLQAQNDGMQVLLPAEATAPKFNPKLSNANRDLTKFCNALVTANGRGMSFSLYLHGPSGTGKSAFARHVAERLGMEVRNLKGSDLLGMYVGQTEQAIASAFEIAKREQKFLILDEVDALLHDRHSADRRFEISQVNELLQAMENHPLSFACTTNLAEKIDSAAMRRFTFHLGFKPLEEEQVDMCFQHFFDRPAPAALSGLSGLTAADFARVKRQAAILETVQDNSEIAHMLEEISEEKGVKSRPIGFRQPLPRVLQ